MDKKRGSLSHRALYRNETAVFLYDLMRHRQAQPAAFVLAGKERIKNMLQIFFGNTDTRVANLNLHEFSRRFGSDSRDSAGRDVDRSTLLHGLDGIQNEVHKYLLHLLSVNPHLGQVGA